MGLPYTRISSLHCAVQASVQLGVGGGSTLTMPPQALDGRRWLSRVLQIVSGHAAVQGIQVQWQLNQHALV